MNDHCLETTGEFLEITDLFKNVYPLITSPTRLTSNMTTLIDNTFTYNLNNFSVIGQMFCDISDRLTIFTLLLDQNNNV